MAPTHSPDEPAPAEGTAAAARRPARVEVVVHGHVQGVGYRAFVRARALPLGLRGLARNNPDGTVTVVAEGETEALQSLVEALRQGPPAARVTGLEVRWDEPAGLPPGFGIA
ncbi:acylphosphatase [Thermaerobacter litoralis]|mgnify:CR=1 FL=1